MVIKVGVSPHESVAHRRDTKCSLSSNQRRLLERMQQLGFGTIRGLHVRNGEPQFDPPFEITRTARLPGNNAARPELALNDFVLKRAQTSFFEELMAINDGIIEQLKVQDGLPVWIEVREAL
jgi:hypothetical protein